MGTDTSIDATTQPGKLTLFSLFVANFALWPTTMVVTLLLLDIAETFNSPTGVMGQVQTLSSILAVVCALLMGIFTVRFKSKTLLLAGLAFIVISATGCFLSVNFTMMLISYALSGFGVAVALPMTITMIAELYPVERRTSVIGLTGSGGMVSYMIGAPLASYIAGIGGWRMAFLWYVVPVTTASFLLALKGLPAPTSSSGGLENRVGLLDGFRGVASNRSALACLGATAFMMGSWQFLSLYSISFYRVRFQISTGLASLVILGMSLCATLSSLTAARVMKKLGRKRTCVISSIICTVFLVVFPVIPDLWLSMAARFVSGLVGPLAYIISSSLALELVPEFRGVMMSMNSATFNTEIALGSALGGALLLSSSYETVGVVLRSFMIVPALIYQFKIIYPGAE